MEKTVDVTVTSLSGENLHLQLQPCTAVWQLKEAIAAAWPIPTDFQSLVASSAHVLEGDDQHIEPGGYTVSITLDKVNDMLSSTNLYERLCGLRAWCAYGSRGGVTAINAVCSCLEDEEPKVAALAIHALGLVAETGDETAIAAACDRLGHQWFEVRIRALKAVGEVAERGCLSAVAAACNRLEDEHQQVRLAAMEAVGRFAEMGDENAITAVCSRLEDDAMVRREVPRILGQVAGRGDEKAIAATCKYLGNQRFEVRVAALLALGQVAECRCEAAVVAACECLTIKLYEARRQNFDMARLAHDNGNEEIIAAARRHFVKKDRIIRAAVVEALGQIAESGGERLQSAAAAILQSVQCKTVWMAATFERVLQ